MIIGERIRALREFNSMSQLEMELTSGLPACYQSRIENGHTIPTIKTLQKFAHAFHVPLYQMFYEEKMPSRVQHEWGNTGQSARYLERLRKALGKMDDRERSKLLRLTAGLVKRNGRRT